MNEVLKALHSMKTTHGNFNDLDVSDEHIEEIMKASVRAGSAANRQSYSIIVVKDKEKIKKLFGFKANCALVFCVDYNRVIASANYLKEHYEVNGVLSFIHGCCDTMLAAENGAVASEALGINRMFTNSLHRGDLQELDKALNIPEKYCFPLITLLLGYEDGEKKPVKGRIYGPGIIHYGEYQPMNDTQLQNLVETYDNLENNLPVFKEAWKKEEYEHYLQWYFNKWPNKPNVDKQKEIITYLQNKGFLA